LVDYKKQSTRRGLDYVLIGAAKLDVGRSLKGMPHFRENHEKIFEDAINIIESNSSYLSRVEELIEYCELLKYSNIAQDQLTFVYKSLESLYDKLKKRGF
jgi:uncharacterized metal-binding protein